MRKYTCIFLTILLSATVTYAQMGLVYVVAGGGHSTAEGVSALNASIRPNSVWADDAGNIFISDASTYSVRKVDVATGLIHTVAGNGIRGSSGDGGPATAASLTGPGAICLDANGNLFIADGMIRKVDAVTGIITSLTSPGYSIKGITTDAANNIYFADFSNDVIRKIDATTHVLTTVAGDSMLAGVGNTGDGAPATNAAISWPLGLTIDPAGNLYIGEGFPLGGNCRLRKVNLATGIITTAAGEFTAGWTTGNGGPATAAGLDYWVYPQVDAAGNIYLLKIGNGIRKIDAITGVIDGVQSGYNSNYGVPYSSFRSSSDNFYVDKGGNFYLMQSDRILKVNSSMSYYTVTADSFFVGINKGCDGTGLTVHTHHYAPGMSVKTYFGDGYTNTSSIQNNGAGGYVQVLHTYALAGNYNIKQVLYNGITALDSITYIYTYVYCRNVPVRFYYDANMNCTYDVGTDQSLRFPVTTEVDSNGVAVDTIRTLCGMNYRAYGVPGDIYKFKIIHFPATMNSSCPSTGFICDTLMATSSTVTTNYFGFNCTTVPGFDFQEFVTIRPHNNSVSAQVIVDNTYCNPLPATLTVHLSPKYEYHSSLPLPSSFSGNTMTWNFSSLSSANSTKIVINLSGEIPSSSTGLVMGDTIHSDFTIDPITGDANPSDNIVLRIDTVKGSYDPNYIDVTPQGYISAGTELTYTIAFENTGNDTAHNIYLLDSLSAYLDPSTITVVAASADMNFTKIKEGIFTRARFNFPNIMLPDSSHHNDCDGMVVFKIKTRTGLPDGTIIPNQAGIYFDDNEVVMTNCVNNIIGIPLSAGVIRNEQGVSVYPNPTTNELTIKTEKDIFTSYSISNTIGQLLTQQATSGKLTKVNVEMLPQGLYYVTLSGENGSVIRKFVKQ